jgi:phosphoribosylamine-glycine ligase
VRVAVASTFACATSWWVRLRDEGADVRVWIDPRSHKTVGDGLVEKAGTWDELLAWAKEGALAHEPSMVLFDSSGLGDKADDARKWGLPVIGGGTFCDRLEKDRAFGFKVAQEAGATLPPFEQFTSIHEARAAAAKMTAPKYFKTDRFIEADATYGADTAQEMTEYLDDLIARSGGHGRAILQDKIDAVPLSTARWWNGVSWVGPYEGTYENKKLMNDDVGPSTGCSFNAAWFYPEDAPIAAVALGFEKLALRFRKEQAPPGIYDVNAIVTPAGEVFFLEWTPRLGYAAEMTSARLFDSLTQTLWNVATGHDFPSPSGDLAYAITLGIPPYPWEYGERNKKGSADGRAIRGADGVWDGHFIAYDVRAQGEGLCVAGPEGIVGLSLAVGENVDDLNDECVEFAKTLRPKSIMYRTDGGDDCQEAGAKLSEAGVEVPDGLLH